MRSASESVATYPRGGRPAALVLTAVLLLSACSGHHSSAAHSGAASGARSSASGGAAAPTAGAGAAAADGAASGAPTTVAAKPTGSAAGASAPAATPTLAGAEGVTGGTVQTCSIASSAAVATAFHARIGSTSVKTSAIGNPLCVFGLMTSNIGAAATSSGTLNLTLNPSTTAAQFAAVRATADQPIAVAGVGDQAYYVANSSTLQILRGTKSVSAQAQMKTPAGTQYVAAIQADLVALGKVIVAQL